MYKNSHIPKDVRQIGFDAISYINKHHLSNIECLLYLLQMLSVRFQNGFIAKTRWRAFIFIIRANRTFTKVNVHNNNNNNKKKNIKSNNRTPFS